MKEVKLQINITSLKDCAALLSKIRERGTMNYDLLELVIEELNANAGSLEVKDKLLSYNRSPSLPRQ